MTLTEYIENLNLFIKENPEAANMTVVYSSDKEGNNFDIVDYSPTIGIYDEEDRDFITIESYEAYDYDVEDSNAVCIN